MPSISKGEVLLSAHCYTPQLAISLKIKSLSWIDKGLAMLASVTARYFEQLAI